MVNAVFLCTTSSDDIMNIQHFCLHCIKWLHHKKWCISVHSIQWKHYKKWCISMPIIFSHCTTINAVFLCIALHIHCISVSIVFNGCITINSVFLCTASRDNITKILHYDAPYTQSFHHSTSCISVSNIYWKRCTNTVFLCPMYSVVAAQQMLFTPSSDGIKNTAFLCPMYWNASSQ